MRLTTIYIDDDDMQRLASAATPQAVQAAIGYLSQWGLKYPECHITVADFKEPELVATYHHTNTTSSRPEYVIAAVWNGTAFSFHS